MSKFGLIIEHNNEIYRFQVEVISNEILQETYYSVQIFDYAPFVVCWDFDKGRLVIQGTAPYSARELEEKIAYALMNSERYEEL